MQSDGCKTKYYTQVSGNKSTINTTHMDKKMEVLAMMVLLIPINDTAIKSVQLINCNSKY